MQQIHIPFQKTGYFSKLICDYINKEPQLRSLYGEYPNIEGFRAQIKTKKSQFTKASRNVLVDVLNAQYKSIVTSETTQKNINLLTQENTFTVVTGHQLNLFTGPLYFLYKIINTINLAKKLKTEFPENNFVPVYWMATEDHDFEEINHFYVKDSKLSWNVESNGVVGEHTTEALEKVFTEFSSVLGKHANAEYLKELFQKAYLEHTALTAATQYLVNELFGGYGLVMIDGDSKELKQQFTPFVEQELFQQTTYDTVLKANKFLEKKYNVQVNPREINLFYIKEGLRERIVFEDNQFKVNNTTESFTKEEIAVVLKKNPEYFSPNVLMRPLYQEVVLPNLCYIGGGGEIAYWLQLKNTFKEMNVPFPVLLVRNSVLLINTKEIQKAEKLNIQIEELFLKQEELIKQKVKEYSTLKIDFSEEKEQLQKMFLKLKPLVQQTDVSFEGALNAQEKKQLKGLENLEKRLLKAEKKNLVGKTTRVQELQDVLFPRKGLQERNCNFSDFYLEYGENLIPQLLENLDPLELQFSILNLK